MQKLHMDCGSAGSKGHAEQMGAWLAFLRGNIEPPLPYEQSRTSMLLTFAVLDSIRHGRAIRLLDAEAGSAKHEE